MEQEQGQEKAGQERMVQWLNEKWVQAKTCPICTSNQWSVSEEPLELRPFKRGGLVIGGPVYPLYSLTCRVCGNTLLFNAVVAGVVTKQEEESKAAADDAGIARLKKDDSQPAAEEPGE